MSNNFDSSGIKAWAENVIAQVKTAFGIGSGKSLMRDEVGKVLSKELGDGLMKNSKWAISAFKSAKTELDYQRKLDLINEETYYDNLETLRDRYFSQGSENWVKYTAEIYKYQKELLENETKNLTDIYDTVADYADKKFDEIRKKQERMATRLSDVGEIFKKNTVYMNGQADVYYSTRDLRGDIENIKSYTARLAELKELLKSGGMASTDVGGFLEEINSMGVEQGLSYMNYLFATGDENAISYAKLWAEKYNLSQTLAGDMYKEDLELATQDVAETLKSALEEAGYQIPEGFFESGKVSAENFGQAFLAELENQLTEIKARIQQFTSSINLAQAGGNTYNSTTQYNISSEDSGDVVEQIKRYDSIKRLSGV